MKIEIRVRPSSREERVEKMADGSLKVFVKPPPVSGRANEAVIKVLAEYFGLPKSKITINRGLRGRKKWVEIA